MIWQKEISLSKLNSLSKGNMLEHIGIEFTELGDDYIKATMPVDNRTSQPFGLLHGGASVVLAETVASIASNYAVGPEYSCLGLDINANHIKAVKVGGIVTATAKPIQLGNKVQVWQIDITNEKNEICCTSRLTVYVRKHMTLNNK